LRLFAHARSAPDWLQTRGHAPRAHHPTPEHLMKTPRLALQLLAAASIAAAAPARADASHRGGETAVAWADHAQTLSSHHAPAGGMRLRDAHVADPSRLTGGRADRQRAQLREGIGRVRVMPHVSLGAHPPL
jgi:hypothetical protein